MNVRSYHLSAYFQVHERQLLGYFLLFSSFVPFPHHFLPYGVVLGDKSAMLGDLH